jgi:hypothetical protein
MSILAAPVLGSLPGVVTTLVPAQVTEPSGRVLQDDRVFANTRSAIGHPY